jgi:hypothetical protein
MVPQTSSVQDTKDRLKRGTSRPPGANHIAPIGQTALSFLQMIGRKGINADSTLDPARITWPYRHKLVI